MSDWASLRVVDLKAELKKRDLPQHGLKTELVARLNESDAATAANEAKPEAAPEANNAAAEVATEIQPENEPEPIPIDEAIPTIANSELAQPPVQVVEAKSTDALPDAPQSTHPDEPQDANGKTEDVIARLPTPTPATEPALTAQEAAEAQGRKRRSKSPPISEELIALKKTRAELPSNDVSATAGPNQNQPTQSSTIEPSDEMDVDRSVVPSRHHATESLYISNLMRPLRPDDMKHHLATLAAVNGQEPDESIIKDFFMDQIRTHALVTFDTAAAASRVRSLLHDCVWPEESNRKALWVDFVPTAKVPEWIDTQEKRAGGGRSTTRWQIFYEDRADGTVEAVLATGEARNARPGPPRGPAAEDRSRGDRDMGSRRHAQSDFRPDQDFDRNRSPSPIGDGKKTRAYPRITFEPVSEELANRRLANMRSFYTKDVDRYYGREINRYSFEDGDSFVDRGKEIFEGIRPPHRQRGGRGRGRGGGGDRGRRGFRRGGPPPFRSGNDRYMSSFGGRDDRGYGPRHGGFGGRDQRRDDRDMRY